MADYVRLSDTQNNAMGNKAHDKMEDGRTDLLNNAGRTFDRWWDYYDGKKTATKAGVGLAIGGAAAGIGVATHGAAVPVAAVIGIAAGGYITGKAADTAIGRLWDLGYKGATRTRAWVHDNGGHKDNSQMLEARAHKTIRHAAQHFRTAREKLKKARQLPQLAHMPVPGRHFQPTTTSCTDAFNGMTALLHVRHHLEKARLYLHPATFLLARLLDVQDALYTRWNGQDVTQLQTPWHPPKTCDSKTCYWANSADASSSSRRGDWGDLGSVSIAERKRKLHDLSTALSMDIGLQSPHLFNRLSAQTVRLVRDAESSYDENRGDCFLHTKHGVTNWWDRKTHSEQAAFVAKNAISAAIAIGGAGAHVKVDEPLSGLAALMDMGFTSLDLSTQETFEGVGHPSENLRKDGKHAQEGLRHAAVHLWEALEVDHSIGEEHPGYVLRAFSTKACDRTLEYLRNVHKIRHHLKKTREELWEMIDLVETLSEYTKNCLVEVTSIAYQYGRYLDAFWRMHDRCDGRCYNAMKVMVA